MTTKTKTSLELKTLEELDTRIRQIDNEIKKSLPHIRALRKERKAHIDQKPRAEENAYRDKIASFLKSQGIKTVDQLKSAIAPKPTSTLSIPPAKPVTPALTAQPQK